MPRHFRLFSLVSNEAIDQRQPLRDDAWPVALTTRREIRLICINNAHRENQAQKLANFVTRLKRFFSVFRWKTRNISRETNKSRVDSSIDTHTVFPRRSALCLFRCFFFLFFFFFFPPSFFLIRRKKMRNVD